MKVIKIILSILVFCFLGKVFMNSVQSVSGVEIERKFKIELENIPEKIFEKAEKLKIIQYYINFEPETRIRSINNNQFFITTKQAIDESGLQRTETEREITKGEFDKLLNESNSGYCIKKDRYKIKYGQFLIELDVYSDVHLGLVVAEVEFSDKETAKKFIPPNWFGEDVTSKKEFKNANLAKKTKEKLENEINNI